MRVLRRCSTFSRGSQMEQVRPRSNNLSNCKRQCPAPAPPTNRSSGARPPIAGTSVKVRYGDDEDSLWLHAIEEAIGILWNEHPTKASTEESTALWVLHYPLIRPLNGRDEIQTKVLCLTLVVSSRRDQFSFRLGMELDACHRSVERALSKTRSAGTPDTLPDSSSSSLDSAS